MPHPVHVQEEQIHAQEEQIRQIHPNLSRGTTTLTIFIHTISFTTVTASP